MLGASLSPDAFESVLSPSALESVGIQSILQVTPTTVLECLSSHPTARFPEDIIAGKQAYDDDETKDFAVCLVTPAEPPVLEKITDSTVHNVREPRPSDASPIRRTNTTKTTKTIRTNTFRIRLATRFAHRFVKGFVIRFDQNLPICMYRIHRMSKRIKIIAMKRQRQRKVS